MGELVTRSDLEMARRELDGAISAGRQDMHTSLTSLRVESDHKIDALRQDFVAFRREMEAALQRQLLRMTVRLGGMIAVAVAVLATINKM